MSGEECFEVISKAGHKNILIKCHDVFFKRKEKKKRLVWIYGPRNTGKSSFISCIDKVFSTQQFNFKQSYCVVDKPSQSEERTRV